MSTTKRFSTTMMPMSARKSVRMLRASSAGQHIHFSTLLPCFASSRLRQKKNMVRSFSLEVSANWYMLSFFVNRSFDYLVANRNCYLQEATRFTTVLSVSASYEYYEMDIEGACRMILHFIMLIFFYLRLKLDIFC